MKNRAFHTSHFVARRSQRGVVLIIALIVLVSMTLAAIGMSRSIDTGNVIAGNMAFKQATLAGGDIGSKVAYDWLNSASGGTTLQNTDTTQGYVATMPTDSPDWNDPNAPIWTSARTLNGGVADNAGNVVRYVIHRMCTTTGGYNDPGNQCLMSATTSSATEGNDQSIGAAQYQGTPQLYYRVTTRVDGPRNTYTVVQMTVLL